jgi:tetratricopeptide (TPR) repeat protein
MKLGQYMKRLQILSKAHHRLVCEYCGTKTAALSGVCMCSNCESIVRYDSALLSRKDPSLSESLKQIDEAVTSGNYDSAIAEYENLYKYKKDPSYLYAEALLAKAIVTAMKDEAEGNGSPNTLYALLLAQLKFGELRGARASVEALGKVDTALLYNYSSMLFWAHMGDYGKVMEHVDKILHGNDTLVNAFFYASLAMFKLGRHTDAKKLLAAISDISGGAEVPLLIEEMKIADRV